MTTKLQAAQPIVEPNLTMTQTFRTWTIEVTRSLLHVGTGSPEGVVEAPQYSLYLDEATPASPVQYRKMLSEVAGDRSQGWVAL